MHHMALPTLPTTYTTRKNIYEAAIVHRRTHESDFRQKWGNAANYFRTEHVAANKKHLWESDASFQSSMDAYKAKQDREIKLLSLKRRRMRLEEMLRNEREQFQAELKGLSSQNYVRLEGMKDRCETLRSAREEKRKQVADEKFYEHFRLNNPDLRQIELKQHEKYVINQWSDQVDERKQKEVEERKAKEQYEKELHEQQMLALELDRQKEQDKMEEELALKDVLKAQTDELRRREIEARQLKREEEKLMKAQWELDAMDDVRRQQERQRKQLEFGKVLLRQHTAALKRRSRQVQEELEEDLKLLNRLAEQEQEEHTVRTARREKARTDAAWMRQVVEEQMRLEKAREAELDMLYQDEAARVWQQREAQWAQERVARERLMKEVMEARQEQITDKMAAIRAEHEESLRQREELLEQLEVANQMTRREEEQKEVQKTSRKAEIDAQVSARREREMTALRFAAEELEKEHEAEEEYDEFIRKEAAKLKINNYQPKAFPRKQAWS